MATTATAARGFLPPLTVEEQQELAAVREQLSAQQAQNEELGRALADGKDAIIERSARADGYAKPNERIWVDLSGK